MGEALVETVVKTPNEVCQVLTSLLVFVDADANTFPDVTAFP